MKKKSVPIFNLTFAEFYTVMKAKLSFMRRDKAEFAKEGVTSEEIEAIEPMLKEYNDLPTDEELLGNEVIATQAKDKIKVRVHDCIRVILNKAANKFGTESGYYRKFGVGALSALDGGELIRAAHRVIRVAKGMLTTLATQGLTQQMITDLQTATDEYDIAFGEHEDAGSDREIGTDERIDKANAIYAIVSKNCDIGKRMWISVNQAKYDDYVIYDTPPDKPASPPPAKS